MSIETNKPIVTLFELFRIFVKLGCTSFGGPAVHVAMMQDEFVTRRNWFSNAEFLKLVGATALIPGPNSSELAFYIGYRKRGFVGLVVSAVGFVTPAAVLVMLFAFFYTEFATYSIFKQLLFGLECAVPVVVMFAILPLLKLHVTKSKQVMYLIAGLVGLWLGTSEILLLLLIGVLAIVVDGGSFRRTKLQTIIPFLSLHSVAVQQTIFFKFLKIGALLYGSGYVLFSVLHDEFVATGFVTQSVLTDAIAVSQLTPGPLFTAATFLGYVIGGWIGAIVATFAIFLPGFIFVLFLDRIVLKFGNSVAFNKFLSAVTTVSLLFVINVVVQMMIQHQFEPKYFTILAILACIKWRFRNLNAFYMMLLGALIGFLASFM